MGKKPCALRILTAKGSERTRTLTPSAFHWRRLCSLSNVQTYSTLLVSANNDRIRVHNANKPSSEDKFKSVQTLSRMDRRVDTWGRFSRDPLPIFSAGGHREQFWHEQGCQL